MGDITLLDAWGTHNGFLVSASPSLQSQLFRMNRLESGSYISYISCIFSRILHFLYFFNFGHFFLYFSYIYSISGVKVFSWMNLSKRCCLSVVSVRFTSSPVTFLVKNAVGEQIKSH